MDALINGFADFVEKATGIPSGLVLIPIVIFLAFGSLGALVALIWAGPALLRALFGLLWETLVLLPYLARQTARRSALPRSSSTDSAYDPNDEIIETFDEDRVLR